MQRERHIDNSGSAFALPDEDAVLIAGAEIHIDALDLVALEAEELGIPELLPTLGQAFIGDKSLVAFDQDFFELMPLDPVATRQQRAKYVALSISSSYGLVKRKSSANASSTALRSLVR